MSDFFKHNNPSFNAEQRRLDLFTRARIFDRSHSRVANSNRFWKNFTRGGVISASSGLLFAGFAFGWLDIQPSSVLKDFWFSVMRLSTNTRNLMPETYLKELERHYENMSPARKEELNIKHWR